MAYIKTEDENGRIIHVPVFNESEDGSGTWHVPVCDTSGYLKVSLQSVLDDVLWKLGTDGDIALLNRSTILAADTALANVLIGTPESQAIAANSLMLSNVTASGDLAFYVNKGGNSQMVLWADGSTGDTAILAASGQSIDLYIGGSKILDISNDGTVTTLLGVAGDYNRIGDAITATYLDSEDDLLVTGDLEAGRIFCINAAYFYSHFEMASTMHFGPPNGDNLYCTIFARDNATASVEIARFQGAADPYVQIGRDDTGVAIDAVTDMLVLQAGAGTNNEAQGFGCGISVKLGNAASEVEERGRMDFYLETATNGSEDTEFHLYLQDGGAANLAFKVDEEGIGYFDAAGAGNAVPTLFDDLDDAVVIKEGIQQRNRELLTDIGIMERKATGSGHFIKLQPMLNLLGGGIYQNRARIDDLVEVLVSEFPQVAKRLAERNLLALPQRRS